jgi:hypothetical protein
LSSLLPYLSLTLPSSTAFPDFTISSYIYSSLRSYGISEDVAVLILFNFIFCYLFFLLCRSLSPR